MGARGKGLVWGDGSDLGYGKFHHVLVIAVLQSAALQNRLSPPVPLEFWNSRATYPTLFNSTSTQSSVCTSRSREAFGCAVD
ncbi:hypothetical protein [Pseudomonas phage vB_PaeP_4029]|nr:hypothetical protein [Pseudomonas phage vB_PaeP_4029]UYE96504.1 hypothetical protein [Pseudomonas phage vB_PaeP_4032]UYE96590.1 hypothetical protein [Pseudomonas phage vB_PaeP_4034]